MTFRRMLRGAILFLGLSAMAGCSALSSIDTASKPLDTFELTPLPPRSGGASRGRSILEVALPSGSGALTSDRIVIKPTPLQIQSLPDARWVNEATEHVQLLLVRSLTNSGRYALVTGEGVGPQPDFVLLTDLQAFQAEVVSGQVSVVITTSMTLMRDSDGRVVSSRSFTNSAQVPDSSAERITAAFDAAMTQQLKSIAAWLAGNAGV